MSDFDKEAERRKLEERFAEEEEKRERTERMSELLLQGATMTDTHCNECGDPLFRYDGQTFCPTCQRSVDSEAENEPATAGNATADGATSIDEAGSTDGAETTNATPDGKPVANGESRTRTTNGRSPDQTPEIGPQDDGVSVGDPQPSTQGRDTPPAETERAATAGGTTDDLAAAEASLSRVLRRQAELAERTDDPGRARDHLAAAREAATALDAVRTARR